MEAKKALNPFILASLIVFVLLGMFGIVVITLFMIANKETGVVDNSKDSVAEAPVVTKPAAKQTVSKERAEQIARRLIAAFETTDTEASFKIINWEELLNRSLAEVNLTESERQSIFQGLRPGGPVEFFHMQVYQFAKEKLNDVIKVHEVNGETRALCRFYSGERGLTYVDLIFHQDSSGNVRVADIYSFANAEKVSTSMKEVFGEIFESLNSSISMRLAGEESELVKHFGKLKRIKQVMLYDPYEAMAVYKQLPDELKSRKKLMILRVRLSMMLGESEYLAAIEDLREHFGNDPATLLLSFDYYLLKENFAKLYESLDRLKQNVGTDPVLDYLVASYHHMEGDAYLAFKELEAVVSVAPDFYPAYVDLIWIDMEKKDFAQAYERLVKFRKQFPEIEISLQEFPAFDRFQASSYYRKLMSGQ
jgi:tetratricopeptide (TPR) repeat protein